MLYLDIEQIVYNTTQDVKPTIAILGPIIKL